MSFVHGDTGIVKPYSPVDARVVGNKLELHFFIKIYPNGPMSTWLDKLKEGDVVEVREHESISLLNPSPHGCWEGLVLLCAGTGITPFIPLIEHHVKFLDAAKYKKPAVVLVWWTSTADEAFVKQDTLEAWVGALRGRFSVTLNLTQEYEGSWEEEGFKSKEGISIRSGRNAATSLEWVQQRMEGVPPKSTSCLICGPSEFCASIKKQADQRLKLPPTSVQIL